MKVLAHFTQENQFINRTKEEKILFEYDASFWCMLPGMACFHVTPVIMQVYFNMNLHGSIKPTHYTDASSISSFMSEEAYVVTLVRSSRVNSHCVKTAISFTAILLFTSINFYISCPSHFILSTDCSCSFEQQKLIPNDITCTCISTHDYYCNHLPMPAWINNFTG